MKFVIWPPVGATALQGFTHKRTGLRTLPEAQRTQGIDSLTYIIFLTKINFSDRNQFEGGVTCIGFKFGHASFKSLAPR